MSAETLSTPSWAGGTWRSPWALIAIASVPALRIATCSPVPAGNARRESPTHAPGAGSRWSNVAEAMLRAVWTSCAEALSGSAPELITNGASGFSTPGWEITIASSIAPGAGRSSISWRAPAAPSLPPSVEAKIIVLVRRDRPRSSASPRRVAVAAALVAAPGPSAESRWASTRIVRSDDPGSVRMTFRIVTSSPS